MLTKLKYMTGFLLGGILVACVSCTPDVEPIYMTTPGNWV